MASMFDYVGLGIETPSEPYQVPLGLPVDHPDARLSSGYGTRTPPTRGASTNHRALDIVAPQSGVIDDSDAIAAAGGTVVTARPVGRYGNTVEIDHGNGLVTRYSHLDRIDVRVGDPVGPSQKIGSVGGARDEPASQRGTSTGPHLDFGVSLNGVPVNPEEFGFTIGPGGRPTVRADYSPAVMDARQVGGLQEYAMARNAGEFPAAPRPTPNPRRGPNAPAPTTTGPTGPVTTPAPGGIFGSAGSDRLPESVPSPSYTLTGGGRFTDPLAPGSMFTDADGNTYIGPAVEPGSPPTQDEMARIAANHTPDRQIEMGRRGYTREGAAARGVVEAIRSAGFSPQRTEDLVEQTMGHSMVPQTMSFSGSQMAGSEPRVQPSAPAPASALVENVPASLTTFERDRANAVLTEGLQQMERQGLPAVNVDAVDYVAGSAPPGIGPSGGAYQGMPGGASPAPAPAPATTAPPGIGPSGGAYEGMPGSAPSALPPSGRYTSDFDAALGADFDGTQPTPATSAPASSSPAEQPTTTPTVAPPAPAQPELDLPEIRETPQPVEVAPAAPTTQPAPAQPTVAPAQPAPVQPAPAQPAPAAPTTPTAASSVTTGPTQRVSPTVAQDRVIDPASTVIDGFVPGIAPRVAEGISRMGVEPQPGSRLGYSPFGGAARVYDSAPDYVQIAATGPGVFGAMDQDFPGNIGSRTEDAIAGRAATQAGRVAGGALGATAGGMFGGPFGAAIGGLGGSWIGSKLADRFVSEQQLGGGSSDGGLSQASIDAVRGYDAEGRGGLF